MKNLITTFAVLAAFVTGPSLALAGEVNSKAIYEATQILGKALGYTKGVVATPTKGDTLEDIIFNYTGEEEVALNSDLVGDEEGGAGTTTMKDAYAFSYSALDYLLEYSESKLDKAKSKQLISQAFKKYLNTGVIFGYDGSGETTCGAHFTTLLIIDVKKKVIYEIGRGIGGPC